MANPISRRKMLGMTASAAATALAGSDWVFVLTDSGDIVRAATKEASTPWKPVFLSKKEAKRVAVVCEAIIPRTDTAGARDARVHEYIDLALSVEAAGPQRRFREGLKWMDRYCKDLSGHRLMKISEEDLAAALETISDTHDAYPKNLRRGAAFFRDIKSRTIYGYYTSQEGRVQELGKPTEVSMEVYQGCTHNQGAHQAIPPS